MFVKKPKILRSNLIFFSIAFMGLVNSCFGISVSVDSLGQREDGSKFVDIWCNIDSLGGECVYLNAIALNEDGDTLNCETFVPPIDLDEICTSGFYCLVWDIGTDLPDMEFYTDRVRIIVQAARPGINPGICGCPPTVEDIDGNIYEVVQIGEQCWIAENLMVTHYQDGTPIPFVRDYAEWENLLATETGSYADYNEDTSLVNIYGRLYNWFVTDYICEICPDGWHVATDEDWQIMEMTLGITPGDAAGTGYRGTDQGCQLAGNELLWLDGILDANPAFGSSGFNALPGGYRYHDGRYVDMPFYSVIWTSTNYSANLAYNRHIRYNNTAILRTPNGKHVGCSIRCIKND